MFTPDEIAYNLFTYHAPTSTQTARYEQLREMGRELALLIAALVPAGTEQDTALARVREAVMWANAGIACREAYTPTDVATSESAEAMELLASPYPFGESDNPFILGLYGKHFPAWEAMKQGEPPQLIPPTSL